MRRPLGFLLATISLLAGCASGQDPTVEAGGSSDTTSATSAPATSAPPPTTAAQVQVPASTPPVEPRSYLTSVRAAAADGGASRVVFEFDPVVPGYRIDYVSRPVTEDGSGDEIAVEGAAILEVRFENAAGARLEGEKVIRTYTGPDRVTASGTGVVTEAVDAGDFEGLLTWAVGLRQKPPGLSVATLTSPSRLVIDVPAPAAQ